jgi:hypothetical protein
MKIAATILAVLLALLCASLGAGSSDPAQATPAAGQETPPKCIKCGSTGRIPCPDHPKGECDHEDGCIYCSVIGDCATCGGTGFLSCPSCKYEPVRAALEARKIVIKGRKIALKTLDDTMGRPLRKAESAHFVLVWEMEKIRIEKRLPTQHETMHLYLKRLEQEYADYLEHMHCTDKDFVEKCHVFVWWMPQDHKDGGLRFCHQNATGGVKLMGQTPSYSVCGNKQHFSDDEKLARNIVHCVGHLLLSAQLPIQWIGNVKGGWADEGLAHWFEDRYWGICDNYCYQEANDNVDFRSGKYRLAVRDMIEKGKTPAVADVFEQNDDTLTPPMHAVAFSYVDYLLTRDGEKFNELCKKLKQKMATRDAMKAAFGIGPLEFEASWRDWVLQTYPKQ